MQGVENAGSNVTKCTSGKYETGRYEIKTVVLFIRSVAECYSVKYSNMITSCQRIMTKGRIAGGCLMGKI